MLMVLKPEKEKEAEAIFRKWGLDFAVVGETTPTKRFIVRHRGEVMADLPIKELGDSAPEYKRPFVSMEKLKVLDADSVAAPVGIVEALERLIATPDLCSKRWVWEQYDHIIRRQYRAAAGRRRRRGARGGRAEGPRAHHRRDAALLRGQSVRRRQAGRRRMLAQSHRGRRDAARDHRQSEFRQSGTAGDHGPVRRLRARHRGSLQGARIPGRVRQRVALQRDQRQGDFADAFDRRRRRDRRFQEKRDAGVQERRARQSSSSAKPPAGSANRFICATSARAKRARRRRSI